MKLTLWAVAGFCCMALAQQSLAASVDFQDVPSGSCSAVGPVVESRGFRFTGNQDDPALFVCDPGVLQSNTSAALINANSRSMLTMTQNTEAAFSLASFFAGGRTASSSPSEPIVAYTVATGIDVFGRRSDGTTTAASVTLDSDAPYGWAFYTLPPSFQSLVAVTFTATGLGATPEFLIDDLLVNAAVPEPTEAALLAAGVCGLLTLRGSRIRSPLRGQHRGAVGSSVAGRVTAAVGTSAHEAS